MATARQRRQTFAQQLASTVQARLRDADALGPDFLFGAVVRRVDEILSADRTITEDEVWVVTLALAERDGEDFSDWHSLNWRSYSYVRSSLGVPPGAWEFYRWAGQLTPGKLRDSADYWLGRWQDNPDDATVTRAAREQLIKLREFAGERPEEVGF